MAPPDTDAWSLTGRLSWLAGGLIFAAWAASFVGLYLTARHQRDVAADQALVAAAHMVLSFAEHELEEINASGGPDIIADDGDELHGGVLRYQVWGRDGQLLYRNERAPTEPLRAPVGTPHVAGLGDGSLNGEKARTYVAWNASGRMQIQAAVPLSARAPPTLTEARPYLASGLLALVVLAWSVRLLMRRTAQAIADSAHAMAARAADNFEPVTPVGLPRELLPLARETNALVARLQHAREGERRFLADAAHELRTPLAALRVQAQLAQRAVPAHGTALNTARTALSTLQSGVDRSAALVDQLLAMSRVDNGRPDPFEPLPLDEIVRAEVEQMRPWAQARGVSIRCELAGGTVMGDPAQLAVLVRNLLDNAVRYAPAGHGSVVVATAGPGQGVGRGASEVVLTVTDNGPGIPQTHRDRVFERFYRVPGTRESGSGLGLSIVKAVADRHGGRVNLEDATPSGARVVVVLSACLHDIDQ